MCVCVCMVVVVVPVLPESNSTWLFENGCDLRVGLFKRKERKEGRKKRRRKGRKEERKTRRKERQEGKKKKVKRRKKTVSTTITCCCSRRRRRRRRRRWITPILLTGCHQLPALQRKGKPRHMFKPPPYSSPLVIVILLHHVTRVSFLLFEDHSVRHKRGTSTRRVTQATVGGGVL